MLHEFFQILTCWQVKQIEQNFHCVEGFFHVKFLKMRGTFGKSPARCDKVVVLERRPKFHVCLTVLKCPLTLKFAFTESS